LGLSRYHAAARSEIRGEGLTLHFGGVTALDDLCITFRRGPLQALIGTNRNVDPFPIPVVTKSSMKSQKNGHQYVSGVGAAPAALT